MNDIRYYRQQLERRKGKKQQIEKNIKEAEQSIEELQKDLINTEQAQVVLQKVAKDTQQQLEYHISELATLALNSIFDDPYEFKVEFVENKGKTEARMFFLKNGTQIDPMDASGGGVVDVVSLALRVSLWKIKKPKSRNVIILDEPAKFVSKDMVPDVAEFIHLISKRLGMQFIIVTHIKEFIDAADKVFEITQNRKGISKMEVI